MTVDVASVRVIMTMLYFFLGFVGQDMTGTGIPSLDQYVKQYCNLMGIKAIEPSVDYYMTFHCFRMAAICQGVYKRAISGK